MKPYNYKSGQPKVNVKLAQKTRRWRRYNISFNSAYPASHQRLGAVSGDYYLPHSETPHPLVIMLHGSADAGVLPCRLMARALAGKRIASFILYMPLHSRRLPDEMKKRFPVLTPEEWFEQYQLSVIDIRQVLDWAERITKVDSKRIGVLGISFGGFVSAIAMAIDRRIKAGVFIVTGGNSEKINRISRITRNKYRNTKEEPRITQASYQAYLADVATKGLENVEPPMKAFLIDPMTFAHFLKERPVMMLNSRWDEVIPREAVKDLWQAAGKPSITWFPSTHISIWLYYPLIIGKIKKFLGEAFG